MLHQLSLAELAAGLRRRDFSSVELTGHYLARIDREGAALNAFITVCADAALAAAAEADERLAAGEAGPLTGIPYAHKDIFCTEGTATTCGSRMLSGFVAPYDATVTRRLREAGMVMLGKTNMDEFAMGSSNENSYYGPVRNPWDPERVPGGSSGGSAAAVAAGLAPVATGTDTGGSIRQPAAFCGITGLKPTYGLVSRYGMIAFASSLDQGGPLARTAEDAALLLEAMAGPDPLDSTSVVPPGQRPAPAPQTLRVGLAREMTAELGDAAAGRSIEAATAALEALGASVREVSLPHTELAIAAYYIIAPAEASSNLARYDGVRFGYRCADAADLEDLYCRSRAEGFGAEVKRRILVGTYALSAGYYDAYYRQAQQVRRLVRDGFAAAFEEVDVILAPTTPGPAFRLGEKAGDPVAMYRTDAFTIPASLAGLPALALPAGREQGLPLSVQLIGDYFSEERLLALGRRLQARQELRWSGPGAYFP